MSPKDIQVNDKHFTPYISAEKIQKRVDELAVDINRDLKDKNPLFIAILNGAFIFAADLFRRLTIDAEISFIKLISYKGTRSSGQVITSIGLDTELFDRTVVILEDIVDTGRTLHEFLPQVLHQQPRQLLITSLLSKPDVLEFPVQIDYLGFAVPNKFILGYGLDYNGLGRNLPDIYQLVDNP